MRFIHELPEEIFSIIPYFLLHLNEKSSYAYNMLVNFKRQREALWVADFGKCYSP